MANGNWKSDTCIRIPTSALPDIELRHLLSERDESIASADGSHSKATATGYTEWVGTWKGAVLSVGWDWAVIRDLVVLLNPSEIRTNIRLVSETDEDEPPMLEKIHILHWIESIPWREEVIQNVLDEKDR